MEQIVTTGVDKGGKIVSTTDKDSGEMFFSKLNSDSPTAGANFGSAGLKILKRTTTGLWMAEYANDNVNLITLFADTGIVMYTKHEVLGPGPFGFVEIGKCRSPR